MIKNASSDTIPHLDMQPKLRDGDHDKPGYRHSWRLFTNVAHTFGVQLTEADVQHWRTMLGVTRAIDDAVDEEGCNDVMPLLDKLLDGQAVGAITETEAKDFKTSIEGQPIDRQAYLLEGIKTVFDFAKQRAELHTATDLAVLNFSEATWYASLLQLEDEGGASSDYEQRDKFNQWLESFVTSGYLFDTITDMRDDFNRGNIKVKPTLANRARIARFAFREIITGARKTPVRSLGKVAYVAFRNEHPAAAPVQ